MTPNLEHSPASPRLPVCMDALPRRPAGVVASMRRKPESESTKRKRELDEGNRPAHRLAPPWARPLKRVKVEPEADAPLRSYSRPDPSVEGKGDDKATGLLTSASVALPLIAASEASGAAATQASLPATEESEGQASRATGRAGSARVYFASHTQGRATKPDVASPVDIASHSTFPASVAVESGDSESTTTNAEGRSVQFVDRGAQIQEPTSGSANNIAAGTMTPVDEQEVDPDVARYIEGLGLQPRAYARWLALIGLTRGPLIVATRNYVSEARKDKLEAELQRMSGLSVVECAVLVSGLRRFV